MKYLKPAARMMFWLCAALLAACGGSSAPAIADWHINGNEAKQIALQTHRLLLIAFMGSDWSEPSQTIRKEVLDTQTFKDFADANLVLVMADFPRGAVVPPELAMQYAQMAKGAQIDRLPVFMLVDPRNGVAFNRITNFSGPPESFISQLQSGLDQFRQSLLNAAPAVSVAPAPTELPPPTSPSFAQPAPASPAAAPSLPSFPSSLPSPDELFRRQQPVPSNP
jgi:hypothetical protein